MQLRVEIRMKGLIDEGPESMQYKVRARQRSSCSQDQVESKGSLKSVVESQMLIRTIVVEHKMVSGKVESEHTEYLLVTCLRK